MALSKPGVDGLSEALRVLREWQYDGAPMQLHPGDLGWHWRFGAEATAAAVRTWSRDTQILAIGLLDGPQLLRLTIAPEARRDSELAERLAQDATEPSFSFEALGEMSHHVRISWDRKNAGIVEVDRFALDRALAGEVLITHHRDVPGVIGRVGTILGEYRVNIAGMQVGRHHRGGEALMVLNVDDEIPESALGEIMTIDGVETTYRVSLPSELVLTRPRPRLG